MACGVVFGGLSGGANCQGTVSDAATTAVELDAVCNATAGQYAFGYISRAAVVSVPAGVPGQITGNPLAGCGLVQYNGADASKGPSKNNLVEI